MTKHKQQFFRSAKPGQHFHPQPQPPRTHIMLSVLGETERRGWVHPKLARSNMQMAFGAMSGNYILTYAPVNGVHPVSAARNTVVESYFLPTNADWLAMFDNDIGPPENVVEAMLTAPPEADIVILPYWVWDPRTLRPALCFGDWKNEKMVPKDYTTPGWHEGGAGGTGAIFIRRRVFEKLEKPYFKIIMNDYEGQTMSEDIYLTSNALKAGCRIFTNASFICSHFRTIDLAEVNTGINLVARQYVKIVQERYGEHGIKIPDLNEVLAMEISK